MLVGPILHVQSDKPYVLCYEHRGRVSNCFSPNNKFVFTNCNTNNKMDCTTNSKMAEEDAANLRSDFLQLLRTRRPPQGPLFSFSISLIRIFSIFLNVEEGLYVFFHTLPSLKTHSHLTIGLLLDFLVSTILFDC